MALAGGCLIAWLAALTYYDVRQRRLPNSLTVPGAVIVLTVAVLADRGESAALGSLALTALYLIVHLAAPAAMGAGDVKLAVGIGALTGAFGVAAWILAALAAPLLTAVWGLIVWRSRAPGRPGDVTVPHGPSMCLAALAAVALVVG